jgi:protein-L-isoaspartate O-methyltransferase
MIELLLGAECARRGAGPVLEIGTGCGYQAAVLPAGREVLHRRAPARAARKGA